MFVIICMINTLNNSIFVCVIVSLSHDAVGVSVICELVKFPCHI